MGIFSHLALYVILTFANTFEKIAIALSLEEGITYMYEYLPKMNFLADKKKGACTKCAQETHSPLKAEEAASDLSNNMNL